MGQASRQARASRFIEEFNDDAVKRLALKVGDKLTVTAVRLGEFPNDESVVPWVTLKAEGGSEHIVMVDDEYYYPESDDEEAIDQTVRMLEISEEEAVRRLVEAELIDPEEG